MRAGITVRSTPTDRKRREVLVDDRSSPQMQFWRARIVLATADGLGAAAIMRTSGVSRTAVWRWQARFMKESVPGRLHRGFAHHPPATFRTSASGQAWIAHPRPGRRFPARIPSVRFDPRATPTSELRPAQHRDVPPGICGRQRDDQGRQTPIALPYFRREIDLKLGWRFQVQSGRVTPINCILCMNSSGVRVLPYSKAMGRDHFPTEINCSSVWI